ncbi:MAG: hypothetical protein ACR2PT_14205 [Endozoicomonas sp.]
MLPIFDMLIAIRHLTTDSIDSQEAAGEKARGIWNGALCTVLKPEELDAQKTQLVKVKELLNSAGLVVSQVVPGEVLDRGAISRREIAVVYENSCKLSGARCFSQQGYIRLSDKEVYDQINNFRLTEMPMEYNSQEGHRLVRLSNGDCFFRSVQGILHDTETMKPVIRRHNFYSENYTQWLKSLEQLEVIPEIEVDAYTKALVVSLDFAELELHFPQIIAELHQLKEIGHDDGEQFKVLADIIAKLTGRPIHADQLRALQLSAIDTAMYFSNSIQQFSELFLSEFVQGQGLRLIEQGFFRGCLDGQTERVRVYQDKYITSDPDLSVQVESYIRDELHKVPDRQTLFADIKTVFANKTSEELEEAISLTGMTERVFFGSASNIHGLIGLATIKLGYPMSYPAFIGYVASECLVNHTEARKLVEEYLVSDPQSRAHFSDID